MKIIKVGLGNTDEAYIESMGSISYLATKTIREKR